MDFPSLPFNALRDWSRAGTSVIAFALACVGVARVGVARAEPSQQPHPVRVHYRAGDVAELRPCASHERIQAAATRALKRAVFVPLAQSDVTVVVQPSGEFSAKISLFDAEGRSLGWRVLEAKDCAELTELLGFALTLMVDFRSDEVARKREEAAFAEQNADAVEPNGETNAASTPAAQTSAASPPQKTDEPRGANTRNERATVAPTAPRGSSGARPSAGAVIDTGQTPQPLFGVYGQVWFTSRAPVVFGGRLRAQHMFETSRSVGQLSAWRVAVTGQTCWFSGSPVELGLGVCLGATPSATWVSATGFDSERTTLFWGVGIEPTFELAFLLHRGIHARLGVGGAIPVIRTDWHARAAGGGQESLFRADAVGVVGFAGVEWGD